MKIIRISEFSEYPGLRHCDISDDSGEEFYHKILNEEFKKSFETRNIIKVDLDGTAGYAPSFLDEAFGNLVYDFSLAEVIKLLEIISLEEPDLIEILKNETFPQWEERRRKHEAPKKTTRHSWWFLDDSGILKNKSN